MSVAAGARGSVVVAALVLAACGGHKAADAGATEGNAGPAVAPTAGSASVPGGDWTRFDYDAQRTGVDPAATGITPRNARSLRVRLIHVDGTVDSSAVELHSIRVGGRRRDVIFVTTTYGKTIALDPGTGAKLWEYTPSDIRAYEGSPQITTATPIIDPDRSYLYAASPDGMIHKLEVSTGAEVRSGHWPVRVTFDPTHEKIPAALNISGNSVVVTTGGYIGDVPPYQGHVVMIDRASGRITHVWNALCSNRHYLIDPPSSCPATDAAMWARVGAVIEPGSDRILVATGNAPFNGLTDWGDSVLELAPDASRLLHNWTPPDQATLNSNDLDLGSTAPALLGDVDGYELAVQGGKDAKLHLLNLKRLNGTPGGPSARTGGELGEIDSPGDVEVLTAPAVWEHGGRTLLFVADDDATAAYTVAGGRPPHLKRVWQTDIAGTSPVLAGGLLYVYDDVDGALKVYDPTSGRTIASLPAATGHWNSPIVVGGRIIEPVGNANDHATNGEIYIYHLPGR